MIALVYDTETTDMVDFGKQSDDPSQPYAIEIAWQLVDPETDDAYQQFASLIDLPAEVEVAKGALAVHGIPADVARVGGMDPHAIGTLFLAALQKADFVCGHSLNYDRRVMESLFHRYMGATEDGWLKDFPSVDTMKVATPICKLAKANGRAGYKWPKLAEAYEIIVGAEMSDAHTALADVKATTELLRELVSQGNLSLANEFPVDEPLFHHSHGGRNAD